MEVRGRDIITGFPITVEVNSEEVREALQETLTSMIDAVKRLFEKTAPELAADIAERGIILTGGGAKLKNLDKKISEAVDLPVHVITDPLTCVVNGSGKILDNLEEYKEVLSLLLLKTKLWQIFFIRSDLYISSLSFSRTHYLVCGMSCYIYK